MALGTAPLPWRPLALCAAVVAVFAVAERAAAQSEPTVEGELTDPSSTSEIVAEPDVEPVALPPADESAGESEPAPSPDAVEPEPSADAAEPGPSADAVGPEPSADAAEPEPDSSTGEPLDLSFELPLVGRTTFSMTSTTTVRYRGNNDQRGPPNPFDDDFFSIAQRFDLALQSDEVRLEVRLDGFLPFAFDSTISRGGIEERRPGWFASQAVGAIDGYRIPNGDGMGGETWGSVCPDDGMTSLSSCYLAWDVRPERMSLRWEHEGWTVEAGDSQIVIGRGIALSFRKVDLLAVDNALRGGHVRFDDGHLRARLHFGLANPQNQDPLTLRIFQDPEDLVLAGSVGATFGPSDLVAVNAHYVRLRFADLASGAGQTSRGVDVLGWNVEMPSLADGRLALYAEANAMRRTWTPAGVGVACGSSPFVPSVCPDFFGDGTDVSFGRAIYASAQLALDELTVLVEWKDYRDFLVAPSLLESQPFRIYGAAPNLEFDGPQRLRAFGNQRGGSVRMDYAFLPGPWSFAVNFAAFGLGEECEEQRCAQDPWDGILVNHGWASIARRQEYGEDWVWSFTLTGGYRREMYLHERAIARGAIEPLLLSAGEMDRELVHGLLSATLGRGDHSLELSADHRLDRERIPDGSARDYHIGGVSLTYSYGIQFVAALTMRWSDFLGGVILSRAERYGIDTTAASLFPSVELQWNFDPGTFVKAFVGATPGGQICSGGVCREVPAFEGVVLQFVGRL